MGKKDSSFASMQELIEEKKKIEKKMSKAKIPCSHTNSEGKVRLIFENGTSDVRCKKCSCVFDIERIPFNTLEDAIDVLHNAINQIKALSDNPDKEMALIKELGYLDYSLSEIGELYKRTVTDNDNKGKKKKKNKDRDSSSFGSYGASNINFIDGRRGRY